MFKTCSKIVDSMSSAAKYSTSSSPLQLTLAILKPDLVQHPPNLQKVRQMIVDEKFLIVRSKYLSLSRSRAEDFYAEHKGKFFYNRLVTYMSSGKCQPLILARDGAIGHWRQLMGPTKVFSTRFTQPASIRGQFGLTDTRNSGHGSDSEENAAREIQFFFPEFDVQEWNAGDRIAFETGSVIYDDIDYVHRIMNGSPKPLT